MYLMMYNERKCIRWALEVFMREYGELGFRKGPKGQHIGYMYYYNAEGKRRQVSKTAKAKKKSEAVKELRNWEAQLKREAATHPLTHSNDLTVKEVVTAFLEEQLSRGFLEKSTHYTQITSAKRNIFPYIGDYLFSGVDNLIVEKWLGDLAARGLTQSSIHTVYSILNKTYNHYFFTGDIAHNPCSHVRTPKKGKGRITFLDRDQLDELMGCLNEDYELGEPFWTAVNLAVLSGLRRGEICGLRFHDVDMERKMLTVETAIGKAKGGDYPKSPKNGNSARTFPMPQQLVEVMQFRIDYVKEQYGTIDGSWFVVGESINYMPPTNLSRLFKEFADRHSLVDHYGKEVTLHSLRHNVATLAVRSNVDIASAANMLGHTRTMMLETYAAADPAAMKLAAEKMGEAFSQEADAFLIL